MKSAYLNKLIAYLLMITIISSVFLPASSAAEEDVPRISVKLVQYIGNRKEVSVELIGTHHLKENGQLLTTATYQIKAEKNGLALYQGPDIIFRSSVLTITPQRYGKESMIKVNQRPYLGDMRFQLENNQFVRPVNVLPVEDYLKGVVPFEMPASWELEALKAQAIAARTYAMGKLGQVIDDTVRYQVYGGYQWQEKSTRAVEETRGQILQHNGNLIEALYSSSNGGITEASESLWREVQYLVSQPDPFDPQMKWSLTFRKNQILLDGKDLNQPESWWDQVKEADQAVSDSLKKWIQQNGFENFEIKILSIPALFFHDEKTKGNRIKKGAIAVEFLAKHPLTGFLRNPDGSIKVICYEHSDLPATSLRNMLGGGNLFKSYYIESLQQDDTGYVIRGLGFGHGVGMSQYGAKAMAEQGKKVEDILAFYYPGTLLTETKAPARAADPVLTAVPAKAPGVQGAVGNRTAKARLVSPQTARSTGMVKSGVVKSTVLIGLRPQASFKAKPVKLLKNGDAVQILGKQERWYKIKYGASVGFVPDQYIVGKN